jgi:hypothetical protein
MASFRDCGVYRGDSISDGMVNAESEQFERFIGRWDGTEQAERANYVSFLIEL